MFICGRANVACVLCQIQFEMSWCALLKGKSVCIIHLYVARGFVLVVIWLWMMLKCSCGKQKFTYDVLLNYLNTHVVSCGGREGNIYLNLVSVLLDVVSCICVVLLSLHYQIMAWKSYVLASTCNFRSRTFTCCNIGFCGFIGSFGVWVIVLGIFFLFWFFRFIL